MLGDARGHGIRQRIGRLDRLQNAGTTFQRWRDLAEHAEAALLTARAVNIMASTADSVTRVDAATIEGVLTVASRQRDAWVPLHAA